ncbi:MAG: DUF72 domain-containing protein [Candidatus Hydrogenedentales bacterium]|jgi:uncharacterized protein YecE (DUF72 family)
MKTKSLSNFAQKRLFIGTAGWSYADWKGIVYPNGCRQPLALLCQWMDLVEINVTWYRPVPASSFLSWLRQTSSNPNFRFTVKAPAVLTHELGSKPDKACVSRFLESVQPLIDHEKLGALLFQFPWSFKRSPAARYYLAQLTDLFRGTPTCIEMRHRSWMAPSFFEALHARNIAFCNIDQPDLKDCIPPTAEVTAPFAYVRLHGRNSTSWFEKKAGRDERYNYLYKADELSPWVNRVMEMQQKVNDLYIVTNNHYQGKAVANALELQASFGIFRQRIPETLLFAYPQLKTMSPR